jgi:hypothetical protein
MDIYVNAINDGGTYSGTGDALAYNNGPGAIGKNANLRYFHGKIDDILMYKRALSEAEVLQIFQWTGPPSSAPGVVISDRSSVGTENQGRKMLHSNPNAQFVTTPAVSGGNQGVPDGLFSQITITAEDILRLIGATQSTEVDTTGSVMVDVGSAGADQTWDLRAVEMQAMQFEHEFMRPQDTPDSTTFASANLAARVTSPVVPMVEAFLYSEVTSTQLSVSGTVVTFLDTSLVTHDLELVTPLPLQFGDTWAASDVDTLGTFPASALITTTTSMNMVDGWGRVLLPIGEFDALRMRRDSERITAIVVDSVVGASDTTRKITYLWATKEHFVLATAESQDGEANPNFTDAAVFSRLAFSSTVTAVEDFADNQPLPARFELLQNYPNPFNPETVIKYQVAHKRPLEVAIFNLLGQKVRVLVEAVQAPGSYEVRWDGLDNLGRRVSSGVYVYQLKAGEFTQARKMIFLQ